MNFPKKDYFDFTETSICKAVDIHRALLYKTIQFIVYRLLSGINQFSPRFTGCNVEALCCHRVA